MKSMRLHSLASFLWLIFTGMGGEGEAWPSRPGSSTDALDKAKIYVRINLVGNCSGNINIRNQWRIYIEKFWTRATSPPPSPGSKLCQFHAIFGGNIVKLYVSNPLYRVGAPTSGISWIRHWKLYRNVNNVDFGYFAKKKQNRNAFQ